MAMIPYFTYELTEPPMSPCGIESLRGRESHEIHMSEDEKDLDSVRWAKDHFEEYVSDKAPDFWQLRILIHVLDSNWVISARFVPYKSAKCQLIFVQKVNKFQSVHGFELSSFPNTHSINNLQSLKGLPLEILPIFLFFLNDPNTQFMGLTLHNPSDCSERLFSIGWSKV